MSIKSYTQQALRSGLFYGTTKVHKLQQQQQEQRLEELTMRPIISNIGKATYDMKLLNI